MRTSRFDGAAWTTGYQVTGARYLACPLHRTPLPLPCSALPLPYLYGVSRWSMCARGGMKLLHAQYTPVGEAILRKPLLVTNTMPNIYRLNVSMRFGRILMLQCKNRSKVFPQKRISPNSTSVFANVFGLVFPEAKTKRFYTPSDFQYYHVKQTIERHRCKVVSPDSRLLVFS